MIEFTLKIEGEITKLCAKVVRGKYYDFERLMELHDRFPKEFNEIAKKERAIAREELNPSGF